MMIDSGSTDQQKEMARAYFGLFLETAPPEERPDVWLKMADLCVSEGDLRGEIHALCEAGIGARAAKLISYCAGRINKALRTSKELSEQWTRPQELAEMLAPLIMAFEGHLAELSAIDCSKLAWLHLNAGPDRRDRARHFAEAGLDLDPGNRYCAAILDRLNATIERHSGRP